MIHHNAVDFVISKDMDKLDFTRYLSDFGFTQAQVLGVAKKEALPHKLLDLERGDEFSEVDLICEFG